MTSSDMGEAPPRSAQFERNHDLEQLLAELNSLLGPANAQLLSDEPERMSKLFIVGPLRSGTTLLTQWLAATGLFAYPTNLLSRFYRSPLVGAKIQQLLTDAKYNFRNELADCGNEIAFDSINGKTRGVLAPNEFWYFWRRFLPFQELDYLPDTELRQRADLDSLRIELNSLANLFERPFALKAMILNQNLEVLASLFNKCILVWVRRNPALTIQSALEARRRQHGTIHAWYSFKIKEYPQLRDLDPLQSVAGQIAATNLAVEAAFASLPEEKVLLVEYERFCRNPALIYDSLVERLEAQRSLTEDVGEYRGPPDYESREGWHISEYTRAQTEAAYAWALREFS